MNDKKNLDRLFQEKFKDFEVEPNEQVWRNIESALKGKEKKRRVIPLWYRLSGIAAALLVLAFVGNAVWNSDPEPAPGSVILDRQPIPNQSNDGVTQAKESNSHNQIPVNKEDSNTGVNTSGKTGESSINETNTRVGTDKKSATLKNNRTPVNNPSNTAVVQMEKKTKTSRVKNPGIQKDYTTGVANQPGKKNRKNNRTPLATPSVALETEGVALNDREKSTQNTVGITEKTVKDNGASIAENQNGQKNTYNSTNPIAQNSGIAITENVELKKLDSAAVATVEPNALEELLQQNEKEKNVIAESKLNRWQITPQIAPIYFGSTSNGSPIDQQFENNDKRYDRNMSYGLTVNYAVSKRLNVRAGVNKLTLGYDTNDVIFSAGIQTTTFENISSGGNAAFVQVLSADMTAGLLPFENNLQGIKAGFISQKMGYIEVPMELSYKLVDDKFGINLIGGISTLFLDENEVTISATDVNASLGKANNLNDVHFSSNLGIGFKYSFLKSFEFNFEPTLKYQINTFSRNSGDFKPYFLGLYSGVSFRF